MTAELLPLPNLWKCDGRGRLIAQPTMADMQTYALANVAHATAAKDAEIEALRAEVARLTQELQKAPLRRLQETSARAELLAEALREYGLPLNGDDRRDEWEFGAEAVAREKRRLAALHPAAAQENGDA